jgi:butyrate kinase
MMQPRYESEQEEIHMIRELIINSGSTSTKLAVFEDGRDVFSKTVSYTKEQLSECGGLYEQIPMRKQAVIDFVAESGYELKDFDAIMCRGGMIWGIHMGGYRVNDELAEALRDPDVCSPHASDLAGIIGKELADESGTTAYIYDAVTGASLSDVAMITGFPEITRRSCCHVLNSHAQALRYCEENGKKYEDTNFIVAHLGGGIWFCAIEKGKIIDSIGDDDGAFSPERSGFTQILPIIKMCYSGKYTYDAMVQMIRGKGGLVAYLGTSDVREIEKMISEGNKKAELLYDAQAYQIAKGIGEMCVVLKGDIDTIILTGGIAHSKMLTDMVEKYVGFLAPITIYPGEFEMEALAEGGIRMLTGKEPIKEFSLKALKKNLKSPLERL